MEHAVGGGKLREETGAGEAFGVEAGFFDRKPAENPPNCFPGFFVGAGEAKDAADEAEEDAVEAVPANGAAFVST